MNNIFKSEKKEETKIDSTVLKFESFEDIEDIVTADNKGSAFCCNS